MRRVLLTRLTIAAVGPAGCGEADDVEGGGAPAGEPVTLSVGIDVKDYVCSPNGGYVP